MRNVVDFAEFESLEERFRKQRFNNDKEHVLLHGEGSVMFSAPHAVEQTRNGRIKLGECRTGVIVSALRSLTNCPVIYKVKNIGNDANYSQHSAYRDDLVRYIKGNKDIKLVIDLHISNPLRPYSIDIVTGRGRNIACDFKLLSEVLNILSIGTNYELSIDDTFPALYKHTVSSTVNRMCNIPAIQLECNWNIISDWDKTCMFIGKCEELVNKLRGML